MNFNHAFFGGLTSVLLCASLANVIVNPRGYYPTSLVRKIVWSDTDTKLTLIERADPTDVVILGSSRAMSLSPSLISSLTGRSAFNAAKSHAVPEDALAMLRYLLAKQWKPKEIVVAVDIHGLCQESGDSPGRLGS